jgi:Zn-dependent protease
MDKLTLPLVIFGLMQYAAFIIAFTFHEAAHAWSAWRLGDPTAYNEGQVTLNPWPHMQRSPIGTMLMPLLSFIFLGFILGWASAPYNPVWAERWPKRHFLMSMAGPLMNLLLLIAALIGMRAILQFSGVQVLDLFPIDDPYRQMMGMPSSPAIRFFGMLNMMMRLNLLLLVFNLLPIPPLDGSSVWQLVLPVRAYKRYQEFALDPNFIMLGLIVGSALTREVLIKVNPLILQLLFKGLSF